MATEKPVVKRALRWLNEQPDCWGFKVAGGPFQKRGVADILGHVRGRFLWAEGKSATGQLSPSQAVLSLEITRTGGRPFVFRTLEEFQAAVDRLRSDAGI